jgi:glycosyltransferase involved in cell wall biosynthesis
MMGHVDVVTEGRRVAFILHSLLPLGGVERVSILIAEYLMDRGIAVDFVLLDEPNDLSEVLPQGVGVLRIGAPRLRSAFLSLIRYLRDKRPDAINASLWPMTTTMILANAIARTRTRIVVSDHNPLSMQYADWGVVHTILLRASIWSTYRFASARVAVSKGIVSDLVRLSGLREDCFEVIYNPCGLPPPRESEVRRAQAVWRPRPAKRILTVGRLKKQKNHRLLISAFKELSCRIEAQLVIVGTGELADSIAQQVRDEGLSETVTLLGHTADVAAWYASADLFVLSSDYEGFGNVIVEALAYGLPVVSTDCPSGPAEILEHGRYGRMVPVGDVDALVCAIQEVLSAETDRKALRLRAAEFAPEIAAQRYLNLLLPQGD